MKNSLGLYIFIFSFLIAVFLESFFPLGISFSLFLIFLSVIIFIFCKFCILDVKEKTKIAYCTLFLLAFGCGILRYEIKDKTPRDVNLQKAIGTHISVEALISDEPAVKISGTELTVNFQRLFIGSSSIPVFGKAIINASLYPQFSYGDLVKISGTLENPKNFYSTSSSHDFDYVSYLAKDNIFYTMDSPQISLIAHGAGNPLKEFLFNIKNFFIARMNQNIPEPEASLLSGILLGAKTSLDKNVVNIFQIAGLSHIITLSGYNITVVASAIMSVFSFLPKTIASSFGILGIILFVIMSGGTSTAVRAGIMSVIALFAEITHRKYDIGRILFITIFLMVAINPKILVFDISFQLSCLATIAIVYVAPILHKNLSGITEIFGLRDIIATALAAQILVAPLILYQMGIFSLVALPANIFIIAIVPFTMFFGFVTGALGSLYLFLSIPFAWISYILCAYIISVATFFAGLPLSHLSIDWFSGWMVFFCYAIIFLWIIKENKK